MEHLRGVRRLRYFYPRPPRGGRPVAKVKPVKLKDFYPRPPRGGRRAAIPEYYWRKLISIHALREEGDVSSSMVQM